MAKIVLQIALRGLLTFLWPNKVRKIMMSESSDILRAAATCISMICIFLLKKGSHIGEYLYSKYIVNL